MSFKQSYSHDRYGGESDGSRSGGYTQISNRMVHQNGLLEETETHDEQEQEQRRPSLLQTQQQQQQQQSQVSSYSLSSYYSSSSFSSAGKPRVLPMASRRFRKSQESKSHSDNGLGRTNMVDDAVVVIDAARQYSRCQPFSSSMLQSGETNKHRQHRWYPHEGSHHDSEHTYNTDTDRDQQQTYNTDVDCDYDIDIDEEQPTIVPLRRKTSAEIVVDAARQQQHQRLQSPSSSSSSSNNNRGERRSRNNTRNGTVWSTNNSSGGHSKTATELAIATTSISDAPGAFRVRGLSSSDDEDDDNNNLTYQEDEDENFVDEDDPAAIQEQQGQGQLERKLSSFRTPLEATLVLSNIVAMASPSQPKQGSKSRKKRKLKKGEDYTPGGGHKRRYDVRWFLTVVAFGILVAVGIWFWTKSNRSQKLSDNNSSSSSNNNNNGTTSINEESATNNEHESGGNNMDDLLFSSNATNSSTAAPAPASLQRGNLTVMEWFARQPTHTNMLLMMIANEVDQIRQTNRAGEDITVLAVPDVQFAQLYLVHGGTKYLDQPWHAHGSSIFFGHIVWGYHPHFARAQFETWSGYQYRVDGDRILEGDTNIVERNYYVASDGIIHLIDSVNLPLWEGKYLAQQVEERFPDWYDLLRVANLTHMLEGNDARTLLIPASTANINFSLDDIESLRELLLYHILPDINFVMAPVDFLSDGKDKHILVNTSVLVDTALPPYKVNLTLIGERRSLERRGLVNGIRVIETDDLWMNGVIQILDDVLIPAVFDDVGNA